ncbi:hypothetical protein BKA63DRAFT_565956 [Paraphoma chrysanthemicola]|nr:hypothetical protein BKA63DRAFT_565956 [Paraphoma chrysanthemicola]
MAPFQTRASKAKATASIISEASRASIASVSSLLRRGGAVSNLINHHKSNQVAKETLAAYLKTRFQILEQYDDLCAHPRKIEDMLNPVLSANGDVVHDFMLLQHAPCSGVRERLKYILKRIYGIDSLDVGSRMGDHPPEKPGESKLKSRIGVIIGLGMNTSDTTLPPNRLPRTLTDSDDMMAILNARGTVLLNMCFRTSHIDVCVLSLSFLAIHLWADVALGAKRGTFRYKKRLDDDGKAWMLSRLILMVRDDIQRLLEIHVEYHLIDAERVEQAQHISVFQSSYVAWQKMINKRIMNAGPDENRVHSRNDYTVLMEKSRDKCDELFQTFLTPKYLSELCPPGYTWNRLHNSQAEWIGPLFHDIKSVFAPAWICLPGIERRECGFWFGYFDANAMKNGPEVSKINKAEVEASFKMAASYGGRVGAWRN